MKILLYPLFLFALAFVSCSGDGDVKFEAYNPEAFAFDIGEEYEVNATVRIKGFVLREAGEEFTASISYELDLVKPGGETEKGFISKVEDFTFSEKVNDAGLDIQFILDSTYSEGNYSVIFNLKDSFEDYSATTKADFSLNE
jgi:hypothetical protein